MCERVRLSQRDLSILYSWLVVSEVGTGRPVGHPRTMGNSESSECLDGSLLLMSPVAGWLGMVDWLESWMRLHTEL